MIRSRNAVIIIGFSFSFVFCLFTIIPLLAQESTWEAWIGLVIGGSLGIWGCMYLFRAIRKNKTNNDRNNKSINLDTNHATSRWMIVSAVGGMLLARLVSNIFDPGMQRLINNAVSAWIITSFSGAAFIVWRYLPKDWKSS